MSINQNNLTQVISYNLILIPLASMSRRVWPM